MIGDVFGGFMMGVGLSAIVMTIFMGRVSTHLARSSQNVLLIYQMLQKKQESEPDYESWDEEWRVTDAEHGWIPDKIDTNDD